MFGMLLVLWGLIKEGILGKPVNTDPTKAVFVYPTMLIAVIAAFSSVKYNMKKAAARSAPAARPIAKPLQRSSKSKLKWVQVCNPSNFCSTFRSSWGNCMFQNCMFWFQYFSCFWKKKKKSSVLKIAVVSPISRIKITVDSQIMLPVKIHLQRFNSVPIFSIAWNLVPIICPMFQSERICQRLVNFLYEIVVHILVLDITSELYQY